MSYSACHESEAAAKPASGAIELQNEITRFENELQDLKSVDEKQAKDYSAQMGCNANSKALGIINYHNELLAFLNQKLEAHKLEFIQGDTADQQRNKMQTEQLKKDFEILNTDGQEIKTGLNDFVPTQVTK